MTEQKPYKLLTRKERGELLFKSARIVKTPKGFWRVTSHSNPCRQYKAYFNGHEPKCECPDCVLAKKKSTLELFQDWIFLCKK